MARLKIGSYIIDAADSGSTSTTSGVQLDLGPERLAPQIVGDELRWPIMYAAVTAASESACKTAVDAVVTAIRRCSGVSVVYEETSGTTLFEMHPNVWPVAEAELVIEQADTSAYISFVLVGRQGGLASAGAADEAGQLGPIVWQYQVSSGGIAGMVATARFGPTLSGTTITSSARDNAVAWAQSLMSTANYPPWMSTAFRQCDATFELVQKENQSTITDDSFDPVECVLTFMELPATLAAEGVFAANVQRIDWTAGVANRAPLNSRAGTLPGQDVTLVGDMVLRTEGSTTWDSSASSLTDAQIQAKALAVIDAVITMFRAVHAAQALVQHGQPETSINAITGAVGFTVAFRTPGVREWDERTRIENDYHRVISRASDGSDWLYEMRGGPSRFVHHNLRIVSDSPIAYSPPPLSSAWVKLSSGQDPTITVQYTNGVAEYVTEGVTVHQYVNPGPGDNGGKQTFSRSVSSIGDGII